MRRGEVWWAESPATGGGRPVVLLSRDEAYAIRALVTIAPVTTRIRSLPVEVTLGPQDGLDRACVANLDTITTISKGALTRRIARLSPAKVGEVEVALKFALGLD